MDSIFNKSITKDPNDEIVTICGDPPCLHMSEEINGSKIHTYRNPYDLSSPPMPGNYLDFMNLVYVAIEKDTINNIPYLKKKFNINFVKDLFTRFYGEFCLARRGIKYFSFYNLAKDYVKSEIFVNKSNMVKEFIDSGNDIERIFISLNEKLNSTNTTLSELLDSNFNNSLTNLMISTMKMEEIFKIASYNSKLGIQSNLNSNSNSSNNNTGGNNSMNENEFFGQQHDLYSYLVSMLKSINETLANPKVPEGMVTREELALSLSKIVPGISEDEVAKILKSYPNTSEVELKLVNYVLKSDFENRLSAFVAKADVAKFVTSDQAQEFSKKTEIIEQFAKYYDRQVIDALVKNLPSRDEIDIRLQGYLLKSDYKSFDGYTRDEIDKLLKNTIDYDKLYIELKKYLSLQAADSVLENYTRKDQAESLYLKKTLAEELYAKKGEIQTFDKTGLASEEYVKNAINQAKLDAAGQTVDLSIYDTQESVKAKIVEAKAEIGTSTDSKINQAKGELLNVINTKADSSTINTTFAKKSEIPSVINFITGTQADQKILESKTDIMTVVDQKVTDLANRTAVYTQVGNSKLIRLGNGDSISSYKASGAESANLIRLSTNDKIELGSTAVNINLNGFATRPTYNNKDLALSEDVARVETNVNNAIANKLDRSSIEVNLSGVSGVLPDSKAVASYISQEIAKAKLEGQNVDLSAYAPKTYVDEKVAIAKGELSAGVDTKIDGAVATAKVEINANIDTKINKSEVEEKYAKIDAIPDITGLATKEELRTATGNALTIADANKLYAGINDIPDITGLAEKATVELKLDKAEAENTYAKLANVPSQEVLNNKMNTVDADAKYATKDENALNLLKTEAQNLYASQEWVTNKINEATLSTPDQKVDLSAYALNTTVDTKIETAKNELNIAIGTKLTQDQANGLYAKIDAIPDTTSLATKDEIAQKLTKDQADALYAAKATVDALPTNDTVDTKIETAKNELNIAIGTKLTQDQADALYAAKATVDTLPTNDAVDLKVSTAKTALEEKITALETKIAELEKKIVAEHPTTEIATTLTVNPTSLNNLKIGEKETDTLTFESNAKIISLTVKETEAADVVGIQLVDKVATITALKEGTTTLVAKAKADNDLDHTYTEASVEISVTVAAADPTI